MSDWEEYYLTDTPFKEASHIQPEAKDLRINGQLFYFGGMKEAYDDLWHLVKVRKSICYVRSDDLSLGTGKSALMAALYWSIINEKDESKRYLPVWASVHDFRTINQLMTRIFESLVFAGVVDSIRKEMPTVNSTQIESRLKDRKRLLPAERAALEAILSMPEGSLSWKFSNIRRTYSAISQVELFTDFCHLFASTDKRRLLVFIDQFEEYVLYQRGVRLWQLGQDLKDLYRSMSESDNLSFIVTIHPNMEVEFENRAIDVIKSYGSISQNAVIVPQASNEDLVKIAELYIKEFRAKGAPKLEPSFPFTKEVLDFVATNARNNPRVMIRILSNILNEAILVHKKPIDMEFIKTPKVLTRVGLIAAKPD